MASQKQISYINSLVENYRIENMPWWDRQPMQHKPWCISFLGDTKENRNLGEDQLIAAYNEALDAILTAAPTMDNKQVDAAINALKGRGSYAKIGI